MISATLYLADQNPHRDNSRGISGYSLGLLNALAGTGLIDLACLTSRSSIAPEPDILNRIVPLRTDTTPLRLACDHLHQMALPTTDLVHYPKGFLPYFPARTPRVVTLHDTIAQYYADHHPDYRNRYINAYWITATKHSLRHASHVVTVSNTSRLSILDFCDRYKIAAPSVTVTFQGSLAETLTIRSAPKLDYVVALASPLPHKRIDRLLELWRQFETSNSDSPRLLLVGSLSERLSELASTCRKVDHREIRDSARLFETIQNARALILPSATEGFGLPALESVYAGTPVVFVRNTAVEEILESPPAGGFFLDDQESFTDALRKALTIPPADVTKLADHLRSKYSWQQVAMRTIDLYRQVMIS